MKNNLKELGICYDILREKLLEEAGKRDLYPEYTYENESGRETPEAFIYGNEIFSIRGSKIFTTLTTGNLDNLKELLDDPELFNQIVKEVFGTYEECKKETQIDIELEKEKEAA